MEYYFFETLFCNHIILLKLKLFCNNLKKNYKLQDIIMLLDYLSSVNDHRQKQGQRYQLHYILLFSIFAILCNADSYRRSIHLLK